MQGNVLGQVGGGLASGLGLKIYQQMSEPSKKDGVWIKSSEKVENFYMQSFFNNKLDEIKFGTENFKIIGTDIYFLSGEKIGKYNTLTGEQSEVTLSIDLSNSITAVIGTDIYFFHYLRKTYKYDTLTSTLVELIVQPIDFGNVIEIGTDIYLFGQSNSNFYKYNTITDTYTQLINLPGYGNDFSLATVGSNIYLFSYTAMNYGSSANKFLFYKYDVLTNTYTQLGATDSRVETMAVKGSNIYFLQMPSLNVVLYKYDTLMDTYTELCNSFPFDTINKLITVGSDIYVFMSQGSGMKFFSYSLVTGRMLELILPSSLKDDNFLVRMGTDFYFYLYDGNSFKGIHKWSTTTKVKDVIVLTTTLDYDMKNVYDSIISIEKFDEEGNRERVEAYIGDGEKWSLLEGGI